ncbi:hypothetical protein E2C01_014033 [Portunus trituberculatus]|uniref:Uncharacterized protein n=1 Tax=Portunus trituberculatus TaxID=210409 RepID=A0A5B7DI44_PORTR|nr:hypothetical protein [Portunus trituberculatus]
MRICGLGLDVLLIELRRVVQIRIYSYQGLYFEALCSLDQYHHPIPSNPETHPTKSPPNNSPPTPPTTSTPSSASCCRVRS